MKGPCEHDNGPSGFINGEESLYQLNDYQCIRKDSAAWSCIKLFQDAEGITFLL